MINRKPWDPNRRFVVTIGSKWERPTLRAHHRNDRWTVTALWRFEQGSGRELLAVTLKHGQVERHMSQARLLNTFREVT